MELWECTGTPLDACTDGWRAAHERVGPPGTPRELASGGTLTCTMDRIALTSAYKKEQGKKREGDKKRGVAYIFRKQRNYETHQERAS